MKLIFSTPQYQKMADQLCGSLGGERGALEIRNFPDGERYLRILSEVSGRDVILLGGTVSDECTLSLYDLSCAISKYGAARISLVLPYYGYSTMERAVRPGEVVTAKTRARLFSSIPTPGEGLRLFLLELHSGGIPHYFERDLTAIHLQATELICEVALRLGGADFVLGSCDAGRAKRVAGLANRLGVEAAFVYKRRLDGSTTEVTGINAHVEGRTVVIYDDMIRTGGTLVGAAKAYRRAGAKRVIAIAVHGLFTGDSLDKIMAPGIFDRVICTDSHPRAALLAARGGEVISVVDLLARSLH